MAAESAGEAGRWKQHGAPLETFSRLAWQSEMALAGAMRKELFYFQSLHCQSMR